MSMRSSSAAGDRRSGSGSMRLVIALLFAVMTQLLAPAEGIHDTKKTREGEAFVQQCQDQGHLSASSETLQSKCSEAALGAKKAGMLSSWCRCRDGFILDGEHKYCRRAKTKFDPKRVGGKGCTCLNKTFVEQVRKEEDEASDKIMMSAWREPFTGQAGVDFFTSLEKPLETLQVFLGKAPAERWRGVVEWMKENQLTNASTLWQLLDANDEEDSIGRTRWLAKRLNSLKKAEKEEVKAFASITPAEGPKDLLAAQTVYEMMTACTSILVQKEDGSIAHARLMDFEGEGFLRTRAVNIKWFSGDAASEWPLFTSTQFAGHLGVFTGMGRNFSVTINQRESYGSMKGVVSAVLGKAQAWINGLYGGRNVAHVVREAFETCEDFRCAVEKLATQELMAPVYLTIAGTMPGEGVVLERSPTEVDSCVALEGFDSSRFKGLPACEERKQFVVVSNSDFNLESLSRVAFSRRNMAQHALEAASELCQELPEDSHLKSDCVGSSLVLEKVLRWSWVTQVNSVYRNYMHPRTGTFEGWQVARDSCGGPGKDGDARCVKGSNLFAQINLMTSLMEGGMFFVQGQTWGMGAMLNFFAEETGHLENNAWWPTVCALDATTSAKDINAIIEGTCGKKFEALARSIAQDYMRRALASDFALATPAADDLNITLRDLVQCPCSAEATIAGGKGAKKAAMLELAQSLQAPDESGYKEFDLAAAMADPRFKELPEDEQLAVRNWAQEGARLG